LRTVRETGPYTCGNPFLNVGRGLAPAVAFFWGYYANIGYIFHSVPDSIQHYFDFEAYGRDIRLELSCCFTSCELVIDNR